MPGLQTVGKRVRVMKGMDRGFLCTMNLHELARFLNQFMIHQVCDCEVSALIHQTFSTWPPLLIAH